MCCVGCIAKQQKLWLFSIGSLMLILGVAMITAWPKICENLMLPLSPTSATFSKWVVTPLPLYFNFYMFNWTNSHLVNDSRVKPNFQEIGPYVFREVKTKEDLKWNYGENLVTYFGRRTWYFEASKSYGSLEDLITAPHLPTVGAVRITKTYHPILRKIVNFALNREGGKLEMTHTVRDWIFEGIYDDMLDFATLLHSPVFGIEENHMGYLYNRNGSKDVEGTFTIHTGKNDLSQLGDFKYWRGSNHTTYWEGECGRVNGTTGELWSPRKKWYDAISVFFSDMYRFLNVYPQRNESYRGIAARRYASTELTFDSGYLSEDTKCFCAKGRKCPKRGVVDFSRTHYGIPIYISHPHFNMADQTFRENTTGLMPDPDKHIIYIVLEPELGVPLEIDGRVMVSLLVERDENIDLLKDLAWDFYAPLIWVQIRTTITDELFKTVKLTLNLPRLGQYIGIAVTVIGVTTICAGVYVTKARKWKKDVTPMEKISD